MLDYILGQICGDLCLRINDTCECGGNTFDTNDEKYCCTPINEKCSIKGLSNLFINAALNKNVSQMRN